MKIKEIVYEPLYAHDSINIKCFRGQNQAIQRVLDNCGTIDQDKDYEVIIRPKKQKRSLDANAYLWTLLGKLAPKLQTTDTELYRHYIRESGVCEIIPFRLDAAERFMTNWSEKGIGWFCDNLGTSKLEGYTNLKVYYGSSSYDTKEMGRLIDQVVMDCNEQEIDTMTPIELERLKQMWGGSNGS